MWVTQNIREHHFFVSRPAIVLATPQQLILKLDDFVAIVTAAFRPITLSLSNNRLPHPDSGQARSDMINIASESQLFLSIHGVVFHANRSRPINFKLCSNFMWKKN